MMFAVQPTDAQLQERVRKLEERVERLRTVNHDLNDRVETLSERRGRDGHFTLERAKSVTFDKANAVEKALQAAHQDGKISPEASLKGAPFNKVSSGPLTMVVRHYVKWEHVLDFERWTDRMDEEMKQ